MIEWHESKCKLNDDFSTLQKYINKSKIYKKKHFTHISQND